MPCYHSIPAWRSAQVGASGKQQITFKRQDGVGFTLKLPCGQCRGCRLERSRQWAMRCVHEASLYESNCFVTLTYSDENLPEGGTLVKKHFQDFMKRLRFKYSDTAIRFFHCGEYGSRYGRPHYHACLFNFDFLDKELYKEVGGIPLYTSVALSQLWQHGFSTVGAVTFESAAYVARYIMKKVTGDRADEHYRRVDVVTGEVTNLLPEYTTMSRRPGIAREWYERYSEDVFPDDEVVLRGRSMNPPRYYDTLYEIEDPQAYSLLKSRRRRALERMSSDLTPERMRVRERCQELAESRLIRSYEDEA